MLARNLFDDPPEAAESPPRPANPCAGERTIAYVGSEYLPRADGKLDRKVTLTRDCGHTYFWSGPVDAPLPELGTRAMACLGPTDAVYRPDPSLPKEEAYFDPRKRPAKRVAARPARTRKPARLA